MTDGTDFEIIEREGAASGEKCVCDLPAEVSYYQKIGFSMDPKPRAVSCRKLKCKETAMKRAREMAKFFVSMRKA